MCLPHHIFLRSPRFVVRTPEAHYHGGGERCQPYGISLQSRGTLCGLQSVAEVVSSCGEDVYDGTLRWDVSVNFP